MQPYTHCDLLLADEFGGPQLDGPVKRGTQEEVRKVQLKMDRVSGKSSGVFSIQAV